MNLHCVGAGADKGFDLQVLFQSLEKQFNLPAVFVDRSDRRGSQGQMIGEKNKDFALGGVIKLNAPQGIRAFLKSVFTC